LPPTGPPHPQLWRHRGCAIESAFAELAETLSGEIDTLGYPRAALFGFGLAVAAANVLAVVKAAVRAAHPGAPEEVSGYDLADELAGTSRGMMIAIGPKAWAVFTTLDDAGLARLLKEIAGRVEVSRYRKHPWGAEEAAGATAEGPGEAARGHRPATRRPEDHRRMTPSQGCPVDVAEVEIAALRRELDVRRFLLVEVVALPGRRGDHPPPAREGRFGLPLLLRHPRTPMPGPVSLLVRQQDGQN
jgi:hypothetical protein